MFFVVEKTFFSGKGCETYDRTMKHADAKIEIPDALGVSEDVLKHVNFCHHDDANWPLTDTPKVLKEKFDKIFDLSKYEKLVYLHRLQGGAC